MSELKRLAEAATPGPWYTGSDGVPQLNNVAHFIHTAERIVAYGQLLEADAAYIATASPDAILALIDDLEKHRALMLEHLAIIDPLKAERDRLREALTKMRAALVCAKELAEILDEYDEDDLLALDQDPHPPSAISVYLDALKDALNAECVRQALGAQS